MGSEKTIKEIFLGEMRRTIRLAESEGNPWVKSPFGAMRTRLEIDSRGEVGERFVAQAMRLLRRSVEHSREIDAANKHWDVRCDGIAWEVKTATLTKGTSTFQHENVQKERNFDGIIFVDIAPQEIFVTFVPKFDIEFINRGPVRHREVQISKVHERESKRRKGYLYKIDLKIPMLQGCRMESLSDFDAALREAEEKIRKFREQEK